MGMESAEDNHRSKLVRSENFVTPIFPSTTLSLQKGRLLFLCSQCPSCLFLSEVFRRSFSTANLQPDRSRDVLFFNVINDGWLTFFRNFPTDIRHG